MKAIFCILVFLVTLSTCRKYADVVYVIDENLPREALMWVDSSVMALEDRLTSSGIGDQKKCYKPLWISSFWW
jgi:hypothetical protein